MKKSGIIGILLFGAAALAVVAVLVVSRDDAGADRSSAPTGNQVSAETEVKETSGKGRTRGEEFAGEAAEPKPIKSAEAETEAPEELTEEEKRERLEDKLVDAFDAETDRWMDAEKTKSPTMDEIENFRRMFGKVPKARKQECLQRALNLIPDENVMLLAGILMDKSEDKELVEIVYNDILNRDEAVKKPILNEIFKDKSHPCWADTAWIFDVTGELPQK